MNSTGANWRLLSAAHIAKSYCFDLYFLSRAKSIRFCGLHKNTQTYRLSLKPVLFIGFVVRSIFYSVGLSVMNFKKLFPNSVVLVTINPEPVIVVCNPLVL
jgi:hypothetical protein